MTKRYGFFLAAVAAAVSLCCCMLVVGAAAWLFVTASDATLQFGPASPQQPVPDAAIVRTPPTGVERETAHAASRADLPDRDLVELALRLDGLSGTYGPPPVDPPALEAGDRLTFWVHDEEATSYFTATASLAYGTPHAYWWVQEGFEVPEDDLEESARHFEERTYPTERLLFGSEPSPGIDGDDHIYIFLGRVPGVGGYFSSPDLYPASISLYSNQHEMFYINLDNAMPGSSYFDGILAHEFEHMIHWATDRDEETWVNEGLAELAVQLNGYEVGGSEGAFLAQPDTQLTAWPETEDSGPHYGASYLFMAYLLDRYGETAIRRLVAEPANGIAGVEAVLAEVDPNHPTFDEILADWAVANYLDDDRSQSGRYGYTSLDPRRPALAAQHRRYPVFERAAVHQYASDYVLLGGEGDVTVALTGSLQVPLVGASPHSGTYMWWSKRGDEGDTTLTREFDLSGLDRATLEVWTWYHLETNYDYAYVEASPDGGRTWRILTSEQTTAFDPVGSSYGAALTGVSGGGAAPAWVQQRFDLTPFAGGPVAVRFEVITDDTIHYPGLCLDDLSIPELGYLDDGEGGEGGWEARGWVRITADVPQQFAVQVITFGSRTQVHRMEIDERMQGTLTIPGLGGSTRRAVLVVTGLAPVTTEWASYAYQVTSR